MSNEQKTNWGKKHLKALVISFIACFAVYFLIVLPNTTPAGEIDGVNYLQAKGDAGGQSVVFATLLSLVAYGTCAIILLMRQSKAKSS